MIKSINELDNAETLKPNGIIVRRYILEIATYPNGKEFQKIFPIGVSMKRNTGNTKKKKIMEDTKITDLEEY